MDTKNSEQKLNQATQVWVEQIIKIMKDGEDQAPRGSLTKEILSNTTKVSMKDPMIMPQGRRVGYKFMAAEAAWILSGDNRVSSIKDYSPMIANFSDDGIFFFGSYGPKVVDQISYVIKCLIKDPSSRQAVINIWREKPGPTKDVPCTISLQFMIRNGKLHCFDTMRSSDMWLGWPYDIFNMSMIARAVQMGLWTNKQKVELGDLYLTAASQHLYENNFEAVDKVVEAHLVNPIPVKSEEEETEIIASENFTSIDELVGFLWDAADSEDALAALRREDFHASK